MSNIFENLGNALLGGLNEAAGIAENVPSNPLNPYSYSKLGSFSNKINKAEERVYLQSGYSRKMKPQALEFIYQQPDITVLIKKRHFSSLVENYKVDKLSKDEKIYLRAIKRLFYNKCRAIAAYERLTKIEKVLLNSNGMLNDYLLPQVFSSVEVLNTLSPGLISGNTLSALDTIKKVKNFSDPSQYTTWLNASEIPYLADVGEGTGVFELTLVTSINTNVSTEFNRGSGSLTVENPLELMIISQEDIEQAISDVVGFTSNQFFSTTEGQLNDTINLLKSQLNSQRKSRKASPIIFNISPSSLMFKKVRAFIDEEGREIIFSFDPGVIGIGSSVSLDQSSLLGINGLFGTEISLFQEIVNNLYALIGFQQTRKNEIIKFNSQNNSIRNKMRLEFEDRAIIQQQDVVHVFVSSKTSIDSKVSSGFNFSYSKDNLLNNIDKGFAAVEQSLNDFANVFTGGESGSNFIEQEKNSIAGPEFPLWLWQMMRNEFTRQAAGTHVFAGIVNNINQEYSDGKYTLQVSCSDFTDYLQKGQINIKPALDAVDSSIYDPLTPFKTNYDPATGLLEDNIPDLLDENIALLETNSVRAKSGRNRGSVLSADIYGVKDSEILNPDSIKSAKIRNQFFDPDGFVYRWKEGIGTLVLSGSPHKFGTGSFRKETSPLITNNIFSGQDVMNTLSLLITGQPYNFSTFLKAATNTGAINRDQVFNYSWSESFIRGFLADINKSNAIWGNFVPFKKMIMHDSAYRVMLGGELDATINNQKLSQLIKQRAQKFDRLSELFPTLAQNPQFYKSGSNNSQNIDESILNGINPVTIDNIGLEIYELDNQIDQLQRSFSESLSNQNINGAGKIKIFGDDITFEGFTESSAMSYEDQLREQEEFRKKLFNLTQRRLWKVKANEDQNLFIVDDSYDKNYDIQAFEDSLGNLDVFRSTYSKISDLVSQSAQILGLEIFADSQGHINARPPAYNRIPSSVFYNLIREKETRGLRLFPEYLESLFFNQIQGLTDKIEIIEDQLRLRGAILGAVSDSEIQKVLSGSTNESFIFVTDFDGKIKGSGIRSLLLQNNPDFLENINTKALSELNSNFTSANKSSINFDIAKRVSIINSTISNNNIGNRVSDISQRLKSRGVIDPILSDINNYIGVRRQQSDVVEITSQISSLISERQYLIKLASNAIKNLENGTQINNSSDAMQAPLFSTFNSNINAGKIPEVLLHMIEDENVDDLGPGSGSRYIIKDSHIYNISIRENPPPFTVVEVHGALANNLVQGPSGLELGSGGNQMSSAWAADYDMWRIYGFKGVHPVSAPYLSDPVAQCAPLAVFLLNQARKNILNAIVVVKGNEYIQAGEVYYLESRDLIMYAESVLHSFSYSGSFTTTLNCTYVRKPGQFIPTMLDIIGKSLYSKRNQSDLVKNVRNSNPSTDSHVASILKEQYSFTIDDADGSSGSLLSSSFGEINKNALAKVLLVSSGLVNPSNYGNKTKIQLRLYYNSSTGFNSPSSELMSFANTIKDWILNPEKNSTSGNGPIQIQDSNIKPMIDADDIEIVGIDLGLDSQETRSPSDQAWQLSRMVSENAGLISENINIQQFSSALRDNLFYNVIDIWTTSEPNQDSGIQTSSSSESIKSEDQKAKQEQFLSSFRKYLGYAS